MCWSVHVQQRRCVHGQLTYDKHCRLETIGELEPLQRAFELRLDRFVAARLREHAEGVRGRLQYGTVGRGAQGQPHEVGEAGEPDC